MTWREKLFKKPPGSGPRIPPDPAGPRISQGTIKDLLLFDSLELVLLIYAIGFFMYSGALLTLRFGLANLEKIDTLSMILMFLMAPLFAWAAKIRRKKKNIEGIKRSKLGSSHNPGPRARI